MMSFDIGGMAPTQVLQPSLLVTDVMRWFAWALMLGFVMAHVRRRLRSGLMTRVACVVAASLALLLVAPIKLSLSLAFQTPSVLTQLLLLLWVVYGDQLNPMTGCEAGGCDRTWGYMAGMLLGWLLLLDTLAILPLQWLALPNFSMYQWGFTWLAQACVLVVLACGCFVTPALSGLGLMAVAVFVITHAPTGNLWDALLDPMLWIYCHVKWFGAIRARR
jgi:hypothetical protein